MVKLVKMRKVVSSHSQRMQRTGAVEDLAKLMHTLTKRLVFTKGGAQTRHTRAVCTVCVCVGQSFRFLQCVCMKVR